MDEDGGDFIDDNGESQMDENRDNLVTESGENVATRERTRVQITLKRRREAHERQKKGVLAVLWAAYYHWQMNILAAATLFFSCNCKAPKRKRDDQRAYYLSMITRGRDEECVSELRLSIPSFDLLCSLLKNRGLLMDTREVTVEEEVATLLHMLAHGVRIRTMATRFFRSGETISWHFHEVLNAILSISPNFIKRAGSDTPAGPHPFEGAVGALDGTHVPAHLPISIQSSFRNRKGTLTQNVLAACGFDMKFQYVLPGWEGSATDARILQHALSRPDGLIIPTGRYYLVDAGFPNAPGFLSPYRSVRYHLKDHRGRTPQNPRELFNKRHSQARNIIERAFGSLKNRFAMLKTAPPYDYEVQVSIVLVCSILHNFILEHSTHSDDEETLVNEICHQDESYGLQSNLDTDVSEEIEGSSALPAQVLRAYTQREREEWNAFRDNLAIQMWEDYTNMTAN